VPALGTISGIVTQASNGIPVPGVTISLIPTSGDPLSTATSIYGPYGLGSLPLQTWEIRPSLNGSQGTAIDMDDVLMVLDASVGLLELTPEQRFAADVSGNGVVTSTDASLILQFMNNVITRFPAADDCKSDWVFLPDPPPGGQGVDPVLDSPACTPGHILLDPLTGDATNQNFRAVLFGDVNGSH